MARQRNKVQELSGQVLATMERLNGAQHGELCESTGVNAGTMYRILLELALSGSIRRGRYNAYFVTESAESA